MSQLQTLDLTMLAEASQKTIDRMEKLVREAQSVRAPYEAVWDKNLRLYLGDHWDKKAPTGLDQFVINMTQNAVISATAVQTERRPQVDLEPRETDDPPVIFLNRGVGQQLVALYAENGLEIGLAPEQLEGTAPIDEAIVQQMVTDGAPLNDSDLIIINDDLVAESLETIVEELWERADYDFYLFENILNANIVGHQPQLVQWNDEISAFEVFNIHQMNVWIDPLATGVHDAEYLIYDQVVSEDEAIAMLPDWKEVIEQNKGTEQVDGRSVLTRTLGAGTIGAPYRNTGFERDMVVIRTMWKRNEQLPMSPDEALSGGFVEQETIEVLADETGTPYEGEMAMAEDGTPFTPNGIPLAPTQVPTGRLALVETGEVTDPQQPNWPMKVGIRQVQAVGDIVIDDRECPYRDIPVGWNLNIPIPHSPYGQGEPERLEDLQNDINRVASILHNHLRYYQSPQENMPQSVKNSLKASERATHGHPGRQASVPDELFAQFNGRISFIEAVPPLPGSYMQHFRDLIELFDRLSGNQDVLQGISPGSDTAARAIDSLQAAARGPMAFKSTNSERMVRYVVRLVLGMIIDFLPEEQWQRIVSKYPPIVLQYIRERAQTFDYDINVELVSGKGATKKREQDRAIELRTLGALSLESLLEKMEVADPKNELMRIQKEQAAMMAQQAPMDEGSQGSQNGSASKKSSGV